MSDPIDKDHLLDTIQRVLSTEQTQELDEHLTAEEFDINIRHLRSSSAPVPDRLSVAFYKIAPDVSGRILSIVFRYQFQRAIPLSS